MTSNIFASAQTSAPTLETLCPIDGSLSRTEADTVSDCLNQAGRAAAAFPGWSARTPDDRAAALLRLAQTLEDRREALSNCFTEELGTPTAWAKHNVQFAVQILRETASYAAQAMRTEQIKDEQGRLSEAQRMPSGVCLGIAPWNAPLILGVRAIAAPLLCGNTVILKGSEFSPRSFRMLGKALLESDIPDNVVRVLVTQDMDSEKVVEGLIANPVVRRVNFTGSTRVGRKIAELCAQHLKRPLLELGGQAVAVVLEDADLDMAADALIYGAFINMGQVCMSTERLVVAESVADALLDRLEARRSALTLGDPRQAGTDLGPVITAAAADRIRAMLADAATYGARLIGGGKIRGCYVEPTLVDRVEPGMRLYAEEVFGPVLSVTRVADELEALTVVNDGEYGLAAAVFSADLDRARNFAARMYSGICHINGPTVDDTPHAPFGGMKNSGFGRFGGHWGLEEFTELRWITSPQA